MQKLVLFVLCIVSLGSYAQEKSMQIRKGQIGIVYSSLGDNDVIRSPELLGSASYRGNGFFTFGINYLYKLNNTFDVETGIDYSNHKITINPMVIPNMDFSPSYSTNFSLINIPVAIRVNFLKYCFINGGIILDIDASPSSPIDSQTGIGSLMGLGLKYGFKSGLAVFVNPYVKMHSLVSFSADQYHQRLLESGFRFGLMYNLE